MILSWVTKNVVQYIAKEENWCRGLIIELPMLQILSQTSRFYGPVYDCAIVVVYLTISTLADYLTYCVWITNITSMIFKRQYGANEIDFYFCSLHKYGKL